MIFIGMNQKDVLIKAVLSFVVNVLCKAKK